jgi:hypothetical protein
MDRDVVQEERLWAIKIDLVQELHPNQHTENQYALQSRTPRPNSKVRAIVVKMTKPSTNGAATTPYPFPLDASTSSFVSTKGDNVTIQLNNCRGRMPSLQASKLRAMMTEAHKDPSKIVVPVCSYDALSSRLCEEAGFPIIFLAGYAMASSLALPDTGYIAFQEVSHIVQEVVRATTIPVMVDGDTGYGGPMNVRRTVEG